MALKKQFSKIITLHHFSFGYILQDANKTLFFLSLLSVSALGLPVAHEDEDAIGVGNGLDAGADEQEVILSVSTIVNGVTRAELPAILRKLHGLGDDIRQAAFETFRSEVARAAMTVDETRKAVEIIKVRIKHERANNGV